MLKKEARRFFKDYGVVSVVPTEKGLGKIDDMHPCNVRFAYANSSYRKADHCS